MKRPTLLRYTAMTLLVGTIISPTVIIAKDGDGSSGSGSGSSGSGSGSSGSGRSGTTESSTGSTSVSTPSSSSDSGSGSGSSSARRTDRNITKVEKVEVENEVHKPETVEQHLADDSTSKKVVLRVKNGKAISVVKTKDAAGKETETESELKADDAVTVTGTDVSGKNTVVKVRLHEGRFELEQTGLKIRTNFPVSVDPIANTISIVTPSGLITLKNLPVAAIQNLIEDKKLDSVDDVELESETEHVDKPEDVKPEAESKTAPASQFLTFKVKGHKAFKLLGFFSIDAPVTLNVESGTSGVKSTDKPWFLNVFGFLFTS